MPHPSDATHRAGRPTNPAEVATSAYLNHLFGEPPPALRDFEQEAAEAGLPLIHVGADVGRVLAWLAGSIAARRVLEVGTLGGYSGAWLAMALPPASDGGLLLSLEIEERHAAFARRTWERCGVDDRCEVRVGAALATLASLDAAEAWDIVFIDADKANYPSYLAHAERMLRLGGLLIADNVLGTGAGGADAIHAADRGDFAPGKSPEAIANLRGLSTFTRRVVEDRETFATTILPIRQGLLVARRIV
jgi:caffeoyl-CoA O-methyltransferase